MGVFNKRIIGPLALDGYEMIVANLCLTRTSAIIVKLNICLLVVFVILHSLREAFNGLSSQDVCQVAGKDKTMTTFFFL